VKKTYVPKTQQSARARATSSVCQFPGHDVAVGSAGQSFCTAHGQGLLGLKMAIGSFFLGCVTKLQSRQHPRNPAKMKRLHAPQLRWLVI